MFLVMTHFHTLHRDLLHDSRSRRLLLNDCDICLLAWNAILRLHGHARLSVTRLRVLHLLLLLNDSCSGDTVLRLHRHAWLHVAGLLVDDHLRLLLLLDHGGARHTATNDDAGSHRHDRLLLDDGGTAARLRDDSRRSDWLTHGRHHRCITSAVARHVDCCTAVHLLRSLHLAGLRLHLVWVAHNHTTLWLTHFHLRISGLGYSNLAQWRLWNKYDVGDDVADLVARLLDKANLASVAHVMCLGQLLESEGSAADHLITEVGLLMSFKNDASIVVRSEVDLNWDLLESGLIASSIDNLGGVLEVGCDTDFDEDIRLAKVYVWIGELAAEKSDCGSAILCDWGRWMQRLH